jgi:hypothetical protein
MKSNLYKRFALFAINNTNWCGSPNDVVVLTLSSEIRIQDGKCRGDTIKQLPTLPTSRSVENLKEQV